MEETDGESMSLSTETTNRGVTKHHRPFAGKNAIVTSASRNLGVAIATALARRCARVAISYFKSEQAATELVNKLRTETQIEHVAVRGDTRTGAGTEELIQAAVGALDGRCDILINNSGPFSLTPYLAMPEVEWDDIWNANVKAAYVATRLVAPGMRARGWGRIVNISAGSAFTRDHSIYSLAKNAMNVLTEELALELGPKVTVNAVAPGQILESADDITEVDSTFVARTLPLTPAGRFVTRAEVAEIVALLCEPVFDMVTGATIPVDGGRRLARS
jgi:NAD(P)-dependent dehydrogenase (short-subunit alcohol dehydrogenase family)